MQTYLLKDKDNPDFNFFGTAKEIYGQVKDLGYEGETQILDGYPLPSGSNISVDNSEDKKNGTVRLKIKYWHQIEKLQKAEQFKSQAAIIEFGLRLIDAAQNFGAVYATTPEGIKKFESITDLLMLKPYFDTEGFTPLISTNKEDLSK